MLLDFFQYSFFHHVIFNLCIFLVRTFFLLRDISLSLQGEHENSLPLSRLIYKYNAFWALRAWFFSNNFTFYILHPKTSKFEWIFMFSSADIQKNLNYFNVSVHQNPFRDYANFHKRVCVWLVPKFWRLLLQKYK